MDANSSQEVTISKKKPIVPRRSCTQKEEEVLIQCLKEIIANGWKAKNSFRVDYLQVLEQEMNKQFPGTDLKATPYINSKIHVWKKYYSSLVTMLGSTGIGWNDTTKMIDTTDDHWANFLKTDATAKNMRFKSWPFYPDWLEIFGKDRATGEGRRDWVASGHVNNVNSNVCTQDMQFQDMSEEFGDDNKNTSVCQPSNEGDSARKRKGKKRKSLDHNDPVVKLLDTFCTNTDKRLEDIAKRIGYDHDVSNARKEVYAEVGKIGGLTMQQKLSVSKQIVKNTGFIFNLPDEEKAEFVRMMLRG